MTNRYYMGQGRILIARRSAAGLTTGYRELGNCTALNVMLGAGAARAANHGGRGSSALRKAGDTPRFDITLESHTAENLAMLLSGAVTRVEMTDARGYVSPIVISRPGSTIVLPHANIKQWYDFVSLDWNTIYPKSTYKLNGLRGSVELLPSFPLNDGELMQAVYSHNPYDVIGAYTDRQQYYSLRFEGVNNADSNSQVTLDLFKIKVDPVDSLGLISDNYSQLKMSGSLMPDYTLPETTPEGRYLRLRQS